MLDEYFMESEEEVKRLYRGGEITGAIHLYIGQEAVIVEHG